MKRIYSFMFAAVAIFTAASCQKEMANETLENNGGEQYTFSATILETKTVLAEGNKVNWSVGDNISVFDVDGKAVTFTGQHTQVSATADFSAPAKDYTPADNAYAVFPVKGDATMTDGVVGILRVGGDQKAVAGSFDPEFAYLLGTESQPNTLAFNNIHSLVKFTIGGETAPSKVTLVNSGARNIAGQFKYNTHAEESPIIQTDLPGSKEINLTPKAGESFEVGKTYYIVVIGGGNFANIDLKFDDTVVKTVSGAKYADASNNYLVGKIINFGTVKFPEVTEEPVESAINVTRVWGHYGEGSTAWSNSLVSSLDGNDRNLAMDDEYIYIPETNKTGNIHKFKVSDGSYAGTLPIIEDLKTATHYTSCVRMVKNSDPEINGGKDVLVVCNLALSGETLVFAAYENGTANAPVKIWSKENGANRRFGDKFSVYGDYKTAQYWVRTFQGGDTMTAIVWPGNGFTWLEPSRKDTNDDANTIGELAWYPGQASYCLISTTSSIGAHLMNGGTEVKTYPALAKTFGYNFFEAAGEKFVAWTSLIKGNDKPRLQIVQSDASTLDKMQDTFDNLATRLVYEAPLQNADNMEAEGVGGGNTVCDCCVREINGEIYIAAMAQKAGLSLFKVSAK